MSGTSAQLTAVTCVYWMHRYNFEPRTILNIGIGKTCPELAIWQWLLPNAQILGVDPRWSPRGNWSRGGAKQLKVGVGDGTKPTATYCGDCRSVKCENPAHTAHKSTATMTTIDQIVADEKLQPPFFIWMDIDGGEIDAIHGAKLTLPHAGYMNVEFCDHKQIPEHREQLHLLLNAHSFVLMYDHKAVSQDRLYRNRRFKMPK